jgi:hypothetical protein
MRRLAALSLGLALAAPIATRADGPDHNAAPAQGSATHFGGHICADCVRKLPRRLPAGGPDAMPPTGMVVSGPDGAPMIVADAGPTPGCAACAAANGLPPGAVIISSTEVPGTAFVGGETPGVAYVGGPASADPAPIGVMRTDYQAAAAGAPSMMMRAGGAGAPNPYAPPYAANPAAGAAMPYGEPPMSHSMSSPGHQRTSVLGHMLGLRRPAPLGSRRLARQRAAHAAISYGGPASAPESLPASMVYGQR